MHKIQQLPQQVISKIAAGEIIERPVYAVKELVENALDAGADSIGISLEESGLRRMVIIDNGMGMSEEDLKESWKPHTTSKLRTVEDLTHIGTLGFRGEALSSIAAISQMTIASKPKDAKAGTKITLSDGKVEKIAPIGMPHGTTITVENLFHSIPARKKFLKSQRTEFRHIIDVVMHFAFAHPEVQFSLTHNGKTILDLPRTDDLLHRINYLLGKDIFSNLIPLQFEDGYVQISGFLAKPQITTRTPHKQYLFINKRKISDKHISLSIKNAYGTMLEKQTYPVCILFLTLPYEAVDVNVHPKKEEVRFANTSILLEQIQRAVSKTLVSNNLTFHNSAWEKAVFLGDADSEEPFKSTKSFAGKLLKEQQLPWNLSQTIQSDAPIIQIHNLYLLTQTPRGMLLIDQHAAHERIMYEQFSETFRQQKAIDKPLDLPKPYVLELTVSEKEIVEEYNELFARLGFTLEPFKGSAFLLRSVPRLFHDRDYKALVKELLEDLAEGRTNTVDSVSKKMLAYLACRSAVKAGESLTIKQCKEIIKQLEETENNATCPHGRPTKIAVDLEMLHKMFKR